jgi:hypothetical protein
MALTVGLISLAAGAFWDDDDEDKPTIELDPRSSNFGKVKIGNTRIDLSAGLAQVSTIVSRMATGETKAGSGVIVPIRGADVPYGSDDAWTVFARFMRTKFSPVMGTTFDLMTGEDVVGQPVTPMSAAIDAFRPLAMSEVFEVMQDRGIPAGTALSTLVIFGAGISVYESSNRPNPAQVNAALVADPRMVHRLDQYPGPVQEAVVKAIESRARLVLLSDGIPSKPEPGMTYDETLIDWAQRREKWVHWFAENKDADAVQRALRDIRRSEQFRNIRSQSGVYERPRHGNELKKWRARLANTRTLG